MGGGVGIRQIKRGFGFSSSELDLFYFNFSIRMSLFVFELHAPPLTKNYLEP